MSLLRLPDHAVVEGLHPHEHDGYRQKVPSSHPLGVHDVACGVQPVHFKVIYQALLAGHQAQRTLKESNHPLPQRDYVVVAGHHCEISGKEDAPACVRVTCVNEVLGRVGKEGLEAVAPYTPLDLSGDLVRGGGVHT